MDGLAGFVVSPLTAALLSNIAYASSRRHAEHALRDLPAANEGPWTLVWFAHDDPNQALLARSARGNLAIAVRGSIPDPFQPGFWTDWFREDAESRHQVPWPWGGAPAGVRISRGTVLGMHKLLGLKDAGVGLVERLSKPDVRGWVTVAGHSLGGALAGTLACYLSTQFDRAQRRFMPITFAAPAIGDENYAAWLANDFASKRYRFHNTLDIVPHAWAGLGWIETSYPGGPAIDGLVADLVRDTREYFHAHGISYRQPGPDQTLVGRKVSGDDWFFEAGHQHSLETYVELLKSTALD